MSWSKLKQNLEGFMSPTLVNRVEYGSTSYRYTAEKAGTCYFTVDKRNILNIKDTTTGIRWFTSEQEIKADNELYIPITDEDIEAVRKQSGGKIPEDRLQFIARDRKKNNYAKDVLAAQANLFKSNFTKSATLYLSNPVDKSLLSDDILLNIFAIIDRRVGKNRLINMSQQMKLKHPAVQYFFDLRVKG